jgi:hypothetical protein
MWWNRSIEAVDNVHVAGSEVYEGHEMNSIHF